MIYVDLFLGFLRVGCFAFGGAYGAIPLIRDVVLYYGWMTEEALVDMIAICESTPGPIMVNLATYVGSNQAGILGAALATLAVITPSFLVILIVMVALKTMLKNNYVQAILRGLKPCVIGIVLATGITMTISNCISDTEGLAVNGKAILILAVLAAVLVGAKRLFRKNVSPISLIILSACLGIFVYGM